MAAKIPGSIEAEHYDDGAPGVAYNDVDARNRGAPGVAYNDVDARNRGAPYRPDTQVGIEARPDASNGHGVGWTRAGEWLVYTVDVAEEGAYTVEIPIASKGPGPILAIEFDKTNVTGPIEIPDSGGWDKLVTVTKSDIKLKAGRQTMRVVVDSTLPGKGGCDFDLIRFRKQ
jgi:hypothetical protein